MASFSCKQSGFSLQMPSESLIDFTGGFPEGYHGPDYGALEGLSTDLFAEMKRALEERPGVLITTCSLIHTYRSNLTGLQIKIELTKMVLRELGIAGGHAYTVMGIKGSDEEGSKLPRLIKIRNPWGNSFEWKVKVLNLLQVDQQLSGAVERPAYHGEQFAVNGGETEAGDGGGRVVDGVRGLRQVLHPPHHLPSRA